MDQNDFGPWRPEEKFCLSGRPVRFEMVIPKWKGIIFQDFGYNLTELKEGLEFVHKENDIYPLWLCPTRHVVPKVRTVCDQRNLLKMKSMARLFLFLFKELQHLSLFRPEDVHVDVGIYG